MADFAIESRRREAVKIIGVGASAVLGPIQSYRMVFVNLENYAPSHF